MNDLMKESRLWYCDVCEKTLNFSSRLRHFKSKSHIHKKHMVVLPDNMNSSDQKMMN